jgi:type I restriction enzyme, S subunit
LLVSFKLTLGRLAYADIDLRTNEAIAALAFFDESLLNREYLYWYLTYFDWQKAAEGEDKIKGKTLNKAKLAVLPVLVPPLPEQQRIVAILDEAFAGLATATSNAEKNLKNTQELFDSYVHSVFMQKGKGWVERPLASLCALFVDSAHRTPKYQLEGIPALRPRDVVNGVLSLSDAAKVSEEEYQIQSKRHRPEAGDIVYSRELSYGWAAALPESHRVCLSQGMCLFRPSSEIESSFLLYVLNGPIGRAQAMLAAVGTAHPHINLGDIKGYRIPTPPVGEQREIIEELDMLSERTQRLTSSYNGKLDLLASLKQSVLQKAFSGELTSPPSRAIKEAAE